MLNGLQSHMTGPYWRMNMSDYLLDMPIVYAGRSYMVRPGSRRAKYLARAAMHYNMRDYGKMLFRRALKRPHVDPCMVGGAYHG